MLVDSVTVPAGSICLPDLDQRVDHGFPVLVHDSAGEQNPLTSRFAAALRSQISA
jgi:hypothetical protein